MLLCATVLLGGVRPVVARYDCLMSGAKRQASCCCKPLAESRSNGSGGCCEITYEDDRPRGVAERGAGTTTDTSSSNLDPVVAMDASAKRPVMAPSLAALHDARGAPALPGDDDRPIFLCTLLR